MKTMKKLIPAAAVGVLSLGLFQSPIATAAIETPEGLEYYEKSNTGLTVKQLGRYMSGAQIDEGGTEIVAYDAKTFRAFSVNGAERTNRYHRFVRLEKRFNCRYSFIETGAIE
ncbi:hypothetical protein [Planococcus shenhongbingii]|uniref:Uncharacterized protein n=1 Tax=Planococcus shenhongbingii TaxID=3058398 RepID=A0ABT8N9P4_9BACL|nr:hypothetical protein [Planococcus sp. N017]MDN7244606.1 hypothetical protein [Planococcus sp. N017]